MKCIDVKTSTYIHFDVENNDIDPKFKAGDHVRVPKHHFYTRNWSDKDFVI